MKKEKTYELVFAGLMVALGLILPFAAGHAFGLPGTVLLPMHIPVLLCGLLCGPKLGAMVGLVVPVLSSLLTGMPPAYPMLPIMATQLLVMGIVSGLMYRKIKLHIVLSVAGSAAAGWVSYGLVYAALLLAGGGAIRALSVTAALMQGIPGLLIQLVLIPAVVVLIRQHMRARSGKDSAVPEADYEKSLPQAIRIIKSGQDTCVVMQGGEIVHTASGRGVSPLLNVYREKPGMLKDAVVADKIIGKAAAMILILGGVRAVYGEIMSAAARDYLAKHDIQVTYGRCVDVITARDGTGICPIEKSIMDIEDAAIGMERMTHTISVLMGQAV